MANKLKSPLHARTNYREIMETPVQKLNRRYPWGDPMYSIDIEGVSFCFSLDLK